MATGIGIDIGSLWIKVVRVSVTGNKVFVTGALKIPRAAASLEPDPEPSAEPEEEKPDEKEDEKGPKGLRRKPGLPPRKARPAKPIDPAAGLPADFGAQLSAAKLGTSGMLGLTGHAVNLKYLLVPPMPADKLRMFVDMEVGGKMGGQGSDNTYDYKMLNLTQGGLSAGLVAMAGIVKNDVLERGFAGAAKAGLRISAATPSAFGLAHAFLATGKAANDTVMLVDIGHDSTEMALLKEDNIYFARSSLGGSKQLEEALRNALKTQGMEVNSEEKIREFKEARAKLYPEGSKLSPQDLPIQKALAPGVDRIISGLKSVVSLVESQTKIKGLDFQRVVLSGAGARLKGLREYMEKKLNKQVQILDLTTLDLRSLSGSAATLFEEGSPELALATGLALLDANPQAYHIRLVPETITKRREFLGKKLPAFAAAAVALASLAYPYAQANAAREKISQRHAEFLEKRAKSGKELKEFTKTQAKLEQSGRLIEYYARQSRPGQAYLKFFSQLREATPQGLYILQVSPATENTSLLDSGSLESGQSNFQVLGYYNNSEVSDFNTVIGQYFKKLQEAKGVATPSLDLAFDAKELNYPPGMKPFRFTVPLLIEGKPVAAAPGPQNSGQPTGPNIVPAPTDAPKFAPGPAPTNGGQP